jgi:hypothetical protein
MERRALIQKVTGLGLLLGLFGNKTEMLAAAEPKAPTPSRVNGDQVGDWNVEFGKRIAAMEERGGGTLELGDGVYEISKPLRLPVSVSLVMTPNAVIRARAGFKGDAVIIKGGGRKSKFTQTSGWIRGGVIDGGLQPLTGLRVEDVERLEIADLEVLNATYKGIHVLTGGYEKNITRVRCDVDLNARYAPGSIGIHYESGDNKVILAHVIGYETGVRSDGASNWFTMIHVWNAEANQGPMLYNFYCNGEHNTFDQCYADSPTIAGFYVNKAHQSIMQCRVYYSRWAKDISGTGFQITPEGKSGNYIGNVLFADKEHRLAKAFDGNLEGACILGTTTKGTDSPNGVVGGLENCIPSGDLSSPPLKLAGTGFRLTQQAKAPMPEMGEIGEVRWVDDGKSSALWVKTTSGWKRSELV